METTQTNARGIYNNIFFTDYSPLQIQQFYSWFFKLKQIGLATCILVITCLTETAKTNARGIHKNAIEYSPFQFQQVCSWLFKLMQIGVPLH